MTGIRDPFGVSTHSRVRMKRLQLFVSRSPLPVQSPVINLLNSFGSLHTHATSPDPWVSFIVARWTAPRRRSSSSSSQWVLVLYRLALSFFSRVHRPRLPGFHPLFRTHRRRRHVSNDIPTLTVLCSDLFGWTRSTLLDDTLDSPSLQKLPILPSIVLRRERVRPLSR